MLTCAVGIVAEANLKHRGRAPIRGLMSSSLTRGFSLVELMIVVAIIGLLAAIAMPNLAAMQLRAKRAEALPNLDAIKITELAYDGAFDGFLAAPAQPLALAGKIQQVWDPAAPGFSTIGWRPDGAVRCQYEVTLVGSDSRSHAPDFRATSRCDVDGDGNIALFSTASYTAPSMVTSNDVY